MKQIYITDVRLTDTLWEARATHPDHPEILLYYPCETDTTALKQGPAFLLEATIIRGDPSFARNGYVPAYVTGYIRQSYVNISYTSADIIVPLSRVHHDDIEQFWCSVNIH